MSPALALELLYIDGRPEGMLTAELFNWTGHVLMAPRTQLAAALKRPEASQAGVYLLIGEKEGEPLAYVGESEDIGIRLRAHDSAKEWWTSLVLVTTAGNKLNKAHVRYLEACLIAEARAIGRVKLENGTNPPRPPLSEADVAKMIGFLENLFIVLPAVRVDLFIQRVRSAPSAEAATSPTPEAEALDLILDTTPAAAPVYFGMKIQSHGLEATARLEEGEFIVEAGSLARLRWEGHAGQTSSYAPLHEELVRAGVLAPKDGHQVFTQDYAFRSPSAAAAVVAGRSTSGPSTWRLRGEDITYRDWETRQLSILPEAA